MQRRVLLATTIWSLLGALTAHAQETPLPSLLGQGPVTVPCNSTWENQDLPPSISALGVTAMACDAFPGPRGFTRVQLLIHNDLVFAIQAYANFPDITELGLMSEEDSIAAYLQARCESHDLIDVHNRYFRDCEQAPLILLRRLYERPEGQLVLTYVSNLDIWERMERSANEAENEGL